MFEQMKNSKLVCLCIFLMCLNGVVGCGYFSGSWDTKYYKYQPTFQDRAVARSMITEKVELIDNSLKEIEDIIDTSKKEDIKKELRDMTNKKDKQDQNQRRIIIDDCIKEIREYIKTDEPPVITEEKIKAELNGLVNKKENITNDCLEKIEPFLIPKTLSDAGKKGDIEKALTAMTTQIEKEKEERITTCIGNIRKYINYSKEKNVEQVEKALGRLVDAAIAHEEKKYTVNGLKFEVKDNCIHFTDLDVSVPLTDVKVSDADVIGFSSDIQKALRWRMDTARRFRLGSGTAQILAASAGATLGFVTKDVTTAAALAAFSAVIPEMQNIFQARDRSGAYEQGLELIQDAEASYYQNRTANGTIGTVSATELTKEGGELLMRISACLKLVDKALLQTIPTIEDLQVAKGRLDEALGRIKVVPASLNIKADGIQTAKIINSKAIAYSVDNAKIVEVINPEAFDKGTDEIKIKGIGEGGPVKVTVYNPLGHAGYFDVTVGKVNTIDVKTGSATKVDDATATLNGTITTNCSPTEVWFEYGTSTVPPFGTLISVGTSTDTGTFPVLKGITGLSYGTQYYFRIVGSSTAKLIPIHGDTNFFVTAEVTTEKPTNITPKTATLKGKVINRDANLQIKFKCFEDPGNMGTETVWVRHSKPEKNPLVPLPVEETVKDLSPEHNYRFEIFVKTDDGVEIKSALSEPFSTTKE